MQRKFRFAVLSIVLLALGLLIGPAGAQEAPFIVPQTGPCAPGAAYDPACDVDHDNDVDIADIQLTAGHWNQSGTWMSDNGHNHLGQTWTGSNNPLKFTGSYGGPDYAPLVLSNSYASGHGLVISSSSNGVNVDSVGAHGVIVGSAGMDGVFINTATRNGVYVGTAGSDGVTVNLAGDDGVNVSYSTGDGMYVYSAGADGVNVYGAGDDGYSVCHTGAVGFCSPDSANANGLEIGNAEDYGVRVINAGQTAFHSDNSGTHGLFVNAAGDSGVWIDSATNWAGYFDGNVTITGACTGCLIARFGVNTGDEALEPGDVVAVVGIAASPFDDLGMLLQVRKASPGSPLVGVTSGRAEEYISQETGAHSLVTRAAQPAAAGDFVSVVIYGPVWVKSGDGVAVGQRVTLGEAGRVRGVRNVAVGGLTVAEAAPSLGLALSAPSDGHVWVLVNPQ